MAYAQDFNTQSTSLLSYLQNQLSSVVSWAPLPGQMNKIVASSEGYVWGFNTTVISYCQEPCDGKNWKNVPAPPGMTGTPIDIAVDDQHVYILYKASDTLTFSVKPVDGSGSWSQGQAVPGKPANPTLNITDQFMFVGTQGCSKPCTTNSWVNISLPPGSTGIAASSSGNTYTVVPAQTGQKKVYQGTANAQGGWKEQPGLAGVVPAAVGADSQFILGVDPASQKVVRCSPPYTDPDSCSPDDTEGNTPMPGSHTLSVNPRSYETYLAASQSGESGNLYQRIDQGSVDTSAVLSQANQYLTQMDSDVNSLGGAVSMQKAQLAANTVRTEAAGAISEITDLSGEFQDTRNEGEKLKRKIEMYGGPTDAWKITTLQYTCGTLAIMIVSHLILGFFLSSTINMTVTIVIGIVGIFVTLYYGLGISILKMDLTQVLGGALAVGVLAGGALMFSRSGSVSQ